MGLSFSLDEAMGWRLGRGLPTARSDAEPFEAHGTCVRDVERFRE
jgi:hypothetical protein